MQKTAQKRNILDLISEKTNIGGNVAENAPFLNPEFKELMDKLRLTDDNARSIALGTAVGGGAEPSDNMSLKDMIKEAESSVNRREYMKAAAFLGRFHKKVEDLVSALRGFKSDISSIHEKFLLEGLDDETQSHISSLRKRLASDNSPLTKEAGVRDFFVNLFTDRGRSLAAWEKRYPEQGRALKTSTLEILKASKRLFDNISKNFKEMSKFRNKRMIEKYEGVISNVIAMYSPYDALFKGYYLKHIKAYADKLADKQSIAPENELSVVTPMTPPPSHVAPAIVEKTVVPDLNMPASSMQAIEEDEPVSSQPVPELNVGEKAPDTLRESSPVGKSPKSQSIPPMRIKDPTQASEILALLESLSSESPLIMKKYLTKYASMISKSNEDLAKKLIDIANRIEV